jgi:hypothetical protein
MFDDLLSHSQLSRKESIFFNTGIDCEEKCFDVDWYKSYKHNISYKINDMAFRDQYHESLKEKIFVIGDSFTMGIGQPYEHTWPYLLEKMLDEPIVKLSADGASNDWIRMVFDRIISLDPKAIFVMLSFLNRKISYDNGTVIHLHYDEEIFSRPNWAEKMQQKTIDNLDSMIHTSRKYHIPSFFTAVPDFDCIQRSISIRKGLICYPRLNLVNQNFNALKKIDDLARDGFHFGKKTCEEIAKNLYSNYREKKQ